MNDRISLHHGDCLDVIRTLPDASFDSCCTDPPYALVSISKRFGKSGRTESTRSRSGPHQRTARGFMGKKWDTGERAFAVEFWAEVFRVMKPGAHLVAFGGTRTYHRLACAIEDAGFEIRDQIQFAHDSEQELLALMDTLTEAQAGQLMKLLEKSPGQLAWLYGSGFPKSHNQKGDWEGWGTALKPAWEPIVFARKPLDGTVAGNLAQHGLGALNIAGCRIEAIDGPVARIRHQETGSARGYDGGLKGGRRVEPSVVGRWPANVIHDGSAEVLAAFPQSNGQQGAVLGDEPSSFTNNCYGQFKGRSATAPRGDSGSAARFFYSAKADATDRMGSKHPTVKPIDLMAYLVRLITPPGGHVLEPFGGSGSTAMACLREGLRCTIIEREAEYVADIQRRIAHVSGADMPLFGGAVAGGMIE